MSRFGPTDPFYLAMAKAESDDRIDRFAKADAERYRQAMMRRPLRRPIVDRDPGDEDDQR